MANNHHWVKLGTGKKMLKIKLRHTGVGLHVKDGLLRTAICHSIVRRAASVGDYVLLVLLCRFRPRLSGAVLGGWKGFAWQACSGRTLAG